MVNFLANRGSGGGSATPVASWKPPEGMVKRFDLEGALSAQQRRTQEEQKARQRSSLAASGNMFAGYAAQSSPSGGGGGGGGGDDGGGFWNLPGISHGKDALGTVLKAAFKPLEQASIGGRAVVAGAEELTKLTPDNITNWGRNIGGPVGNLFQIDQQGMEYQQNDELAARSFTDRITDPTYGTGTVLRDTNNAWMDRATGLGGDITADPLSYVTLGAGRFASQSGRFAAAKILDDAVDDVGRKLFTQAENQVVRRKGVNHASQAQRDFLGQGLPGVRFAGATIPGTKNFASATGRGLDNTRDVIMRGRVGRGISKLRNPANHGLRKDLDIIAGRKKGDLNAAIATTSAGDVRRVTTGMARRSFQEHDFLKGLGKEGREGRVAMTHALESAGGFKRGLNELWDRADDMRQGLFGALKGAGASGMNRRGNYVRHLWTRQARKRGLENRLVRLNKNGHKTTINMAESRGAAHARRLDVGAYEVVGDSGKRYTVTLNEGTIDEINRKIGGAMADNPNALPDGNFVKVLEDDYGIIWERTVLDGAADIGQAKALKYLQLHNPELVQGWNEIAGMSIEAEDVLAELGTSLGGARNAAGRIDDAVEEAALRNKALDKTHLNMMKRNDKQWSEVTTKKFMEYGRSGKLGPQVKDMIDGEFEILSTKLFAAGDELLMVPQLRESFQPLIDAVNKNWFWETMDEYTRMFKSYAVLSPGFHIRNGMSAVFMNLSDGVTPGDHIEAARWFKRWLTEGDKVFADSKAPKNLEQMFDAVWASGAQGSMSPYEVGVKGGEGLGRDALEKTRAGAVVAKGLDAVADNKVLRGNMHVGANFVEGPLRLAAAMNTFKRAGAGGVEAAREEAIARITRLHFDYSQLSDADVVMKRVIPFWTFMSRNIPLQMQQMYMKPKAYAAWNHVRKNFDMAEEGDVMPELWGDEGGVNTKINILGGHDWVLKPDLPFANLQGDAGVFANPSKLMGNMNPLMKTSAEIFFDRKFHNGQGFYPDENKWLYFLSSTLPPISRGDALSGGQITQLAADLTGGPEDARDYKSERAGSSWATFLGFPGQQLTQSKIDQELRRLAREGQL